MVSVVCVLIRSFVKFREKKFSFLNCSIMGFVVCYSYVL